MFTEVKMKKGQGAIEFAIITAAVLFFFVILLYAVQRETQQELKGKEALVVENIALTVKDEIDLATKSSEGYYREFSLPKTVLGSQYSINITDGFVYVKTENSGVAHKVMNVTGAIQKENNTIKKENGTVYLN